MDDGLKKVGLVFKADGAVDFKKSLSEVNQEINSNRTAYALARSEWDKGTSSVQKLKTQQGYLQEQTETYTEKVRQLNEILAQQESAENRDEAAIAKTKQQIDQTQTTLNNYKKNLDEVNSKLESGQAQLEEFGKKLGKAGEYAENAGKKLAPLSAAAASIGTGAIVMASNFEDAMAKVSTIADETQVPMDELEESIMNLSNQSGVAATDIANNVYDAISAGQSTGDAVNFVSNATMLAKAGFTESSSALDILTTVMNAYGLEANKVNSVSDMLIQTQNLGKTTVDQLASSMGKVIPTANANNVQIDQLCASYAILTSNGIATAESTTYLNSMLNELGKGGTNVDKVLREQTGKSFSELSAEGMSLSDVLDIVNKYADSNGKSFSDMWSSSEAAKAGIVLLGDSADTFNQTLGQMNGASGSTNEAFDKLQTTSTKAKITINELKNSGIELGTTMISSLEPTIETVSEAVQHFTEWFNSLDENQKQTIATIIALVAALAPVLIIGGKIFSGAQSIITVISSLLPVLGSLNAVLLANPIILVVAAIAALIAIFVLLWNNCDGFRQFWIDLWNNITGFCSDAVEKVKQGIENVGAFFTSIPGKIHDGVEGFKEKVTSGFTNTFSKVDELTGGRLSGTIELAKDRLGQMQQAYNDAGGGIKGIAAGMMTGVNNYFKDGFSAINSLTGGKLGNLVSTVSGKFSSIKDKALDLINRIKGIFDFDWHFPKLKMPHFKISGGFSFVPPKTPKLDIDWYAKGGILNRPTIFGMNGDKALGGGEAGPEAVLPIALLKEYISDANSRSNADLVAALKDVLGEVIYEAFLRAIQKFNPSIVFDEEKVGELLSDYMRKEVFA